MNKPHVWGTDIKLLVVAHLLSTCIHFYMTREQKWWVYRPSTLDKALAIDSAAQASILDILHFTMMLCLQLEHHCLQMTKLMRPKSQNLIVWSAVVAMPTTLHLPKKTRTEGQQQTEERLVWSSLTFHSVDEHWQDYHVLYFQFRLCVLIKYFKVVLLWYLNVHRTHKI